MAIKWTNDLSLGIGEIDRQHRELIRQAAAVENAALENAEITKDELDAHFEFLTGYIKFHFGSEEKVMLGYGYPETAAHKKIHDNFSEKLGKLRKNAKLSGPDAALEILRNGVYGWFIKHIKNTDGALAAFIRKKI